MSLRELPAGTYYAVITGGSTFDASANKYTAILYLNGSPTGCDGREK